jgi:ATP-binding cassette subfamily A (ABC1) protein 3
MLIFFVPFYYLVVKMAEEKESKVREGMRMMGLEDSSYFISWLIFYLVILTVTCIIATVILSINVFLQSNKFLVFIFAFLFGFSMYGVSIVIVALFPKKRSSATVAAIFFFLSYFLTFAVNSPATSRGTKVAFSLLPNIAMSYTMSTLYHFEMQGAGLTMSSINSLYANFTFADGLLMIILDCFLYTLLGLYLDQVVPSEFGVQLRWNFFCKKTYWCPGRGEVKS